LPPCGRFTSLNRACEPFELNPPRAEGGRFAPQFPPLEAARPSKFRCALGGRFESYPPFEPLRPYPVVLAEPKLLPAFEPREFIAPTLPPRLGAPPLLPRPYPEPEFAYEFP